MNRSRMRSSRSSRIASVLATGALAALVMSTAAQTADAPHPAHIHSGTCEELGDVVVPLADVAAPDGADATGAASALPVKTSVNRVEMPLQAIIDGGHAINIHQSADEIDVYIACGAIGGVVADDQLVVGLGELNDSGHSGVAVLTADGEATDVTVHLLEAAGDGASADASQEVDAATSANASPVEIKSFAYNPDPITVPVGGSVTWTNQDNVPHTATAEDRAILQSGAIAFDGSFTQSFDAAGSYNYFCEFHPNMKGVIVVE